ncbi:MAG: DNA starvation/stationary phase protection protein [Saprospiraceae bacterium]|nr:DNA starvation/stationary phase protection protein [Saprospiraceae bacterium]
MNYLGIDRKKISKTAMLLNELLASYQVYYNNLRNFHWNIAGENFFDLHAKFEELYQDARVKIDEIAERVLTLRYRPVSRMSDYMDMSKVEDAQYLDSDRDMVQTILNNHMILIGQMRQVLAEAADADDEGTIDMIGSFLKDLEKRSWMLDAWVTRKVDAMLQ